MIALLAPSLTVACLAGGAALVVLWARRRMRGWPGGPSRAHLEVLDRRGLHTNQGVAVLRVGRRHVLVSYGEGGARTLMELDADDLELGEPRRAAPGSSEEEPTLRLQPRPAARSWRRLGVGLGIAALAILPVEALGQVGGAPLLPPIGPPAASGQDAMDLDAALQGLPQVSLQVGDEDGGLQLHGTVGTVLVLGLLALAPTLLLLTTSFTRILVVLHLLRQALGTQNTPPSHMLAGLALLLSAVVMAPTLDQVRAAAVDPWMAGELTEGEMLDIAVRPIRAFMLEHTRDSDLRTFLRISRSPAPATADDISTVVLMSAFATSELRAAFEIGFAIFLPFIMIDLVVAAVLTSMGMFMLPPAMIALPCKLMLFVLMDGWALVMGTLADSFL